jgi:hypothetical protein
MTKQPFMDYLSRGWSVIPLLPGSKSPCIPWREYQQRLATDEVVQGWTERWPQANVGIVTGAVSGLIVLDADTPEAWEEVQRRGLPPTPIVSTGKGKHIYLRHPGGEVRNFVRKLPGLDLRADGGYVVAPPSLHPEGRRYTWETPPDTLLGDSPDWFLGWINSGDPKPTDIMTLTVQTKGEPTPGQPWKVN